MKKDAKRFSVIIPVYRSERTLERCIEGLKRQTFEDFSVIFVDSSPDDRSVRMIQADAGFQIIRPGKRMWMHAARNLGARQAVGEILVFTDPDCVPAPDWLSELDGSFTDGEDVVGGPVACYPGGYVDGAAHIVKYWMWLPNGESSYVSDLPSANLAILKDTFEMAGGFGEKHFSSDTLFCTQLRERGLRLFFNSRAVVEHIHETRASSLLVERYLRGRDFCSMRSAMRSWNRLKSVLLLLGFWILPLRQVFWKLRVCVQRGFLPTFVRSLPLVVVSDYAWMLGQASSSFRHLVGGNLSSLSD